MLYNKDRFYKYDDKKVLHKIKKRWVTISLALLMMIGSGAVAEQASASGNGNDNPARHVINVSSPQQSIDILRDRASSDVRSTSNDASSMKSTNGIASNYVRKISSDYKSISNFNKDVSNSYVSDSLESYFDEVKSMDPNTVAVSDSDSISNDVMSLNKASNNASGAASDANISTSYSSISDDASRADDDNKAASLDFNSASVTLSSLSSLASTINSIYSDAAGIYDSLKNSASDNISDNGISANVSDIDSYASIASNNNVQASNANLNASNVDSLIQSISSSLLNYGNVSATASANSELSSYAHDVVFNDNIVSSDNTLVNSVYAKISSYASNDANEDNQTNPASASSEDSKVRADKSLVSSYANSTSSAISSAVKQIGSATSQIDNDSLNANDFNGYILDPSQIDNNSVYDAITHAKPGDVPGVITLVNGGQSVRYVINVRPGCYIKLADGQISEIGLKNDNTIYAYDPKINKNITDFTDTSSLPNYDNFNIEYNIYPKVKFVYDNGDRTRSIDTDYKGLNFNSKYMNNGVLSVPLTVSGHYDEPHDISADDIDGVGTNLYPHFQLDTQGSANPSNLTIVLDKGIPGDKNTAKNDDGHYWLNGQNTVTMVARRYFAHVVYTYENHTYDLPDDTPTGATTAGFAGDSVDIYDKFNQAIKDGQISSDLEIKPNQSATLNNSSSKSHPQIVYVHLTPKTNAWEQMPVILEDYDNPNVAKYPAMVDLNNINYGQPYSYNIQRNTVHPQLNPDIIKELHKIYGDQSNNPLDDGYLISAGKLNVSDDIVNNNLSSHWIDLENYTKKNGSSNNFIIDRKNVSGAVNVGSYEMTSGPYAGQIVPVFYFKRYQNKGYNDLINIPYVHYNYRFWGPDDRSGDNDSKYDNICVKKPTVYNHFSSNSDDADKVHDNSSNAYNFLTNHNYNLTGMSGNAAPTGFIAQMTPWNAVAQDFKVEDSNNPDNDWYVQFVRNDDPDKSGKVDSSKVNIRLLKGDSNSLFVNHTPYSGPEKDHPILYYGIADGNGSNQTLSTKNGIDYVTVANGNSTVTYPRNATILWDEDANGGSGAFCQYKDEGHNGYGQYYYGDGKTPIDFQLNEDQDQNVQPNGYVGDMNDYAQPVSYGVEFLGSGNYLNYDQTTVQDSNQYPQNEDYVFPNYTSNVPSNPGAYNDVENNKNLPQRAYAGDQISFNSNDGYFYLNYINGKSIKLFGIPKYSNPNSSSPYQLMYDRGYETSYLNALLSAEEDGHDIRPQSCVTNIGSDNENHPTDPSWTLGIGNPNWNIWPEGYDLKGNNAVVYLADQQIKAYNKIHFVSLDTGEKETAPLKNQNEKQEIQSLFSKNNDSGMRFDMSDFLRNFMENEANSTFDKGDGSWRLQTAIGDGKTENIWIVRTDSPNEPNNLNNTFIYVATQDFNNKNNWGHIRIPVTVHYVSTDGSEIDNGSHGFTVRGLLHDETVDQAMKEDHKSFWPYLNARYQEVGVLPGDFQPGPYNNETPNNDYNNSYLRDDKDIFGITPSITIVLQKLSNNTKTFHVQFIDDDPDSENLSSHNVYENSSNGSTGKVSSTTMNNLNSSISTLIDGGYQVDYYDNNGQKHSIDTTKDKTEISDLEKMLADNSDYDDQNIVIHLGHQDVPDPETKTITENIHYIVNGNRALDPTPSTQYVTFVRTNVRDKVTDKIRSFGNWQLQRTRSNVNSLSDKLSPKVNGYYPNDDEVYAPKIDVSNLENTQDVYNYNVYYYPNDEPVDPSDNNRPKNDNGDHDQPNHPNGPSKLPRHNNDNSGGNVPNNPIVPSSHGSHGTPVNPSDNNGHDGHDNQPNHPVTPPSPHNHGGHSVPNNNGGHSEPSNPVIPSNHNNNHRHGSDHVPHNHGDNVPTQPVIPLPVAPVTPINPNPSPNYSGNNKNNTSDLSSKTESSSASVSDYINGNVQNKSKKKIKGQAKKRNKVIKYEMNKKDWSNDKHKSKELKKVNESLKSSKRVSKRNVRQSKTYYYRDRNRLERKQKRMVNKAITDRYYGVYGRDKSHGNVGRYGSNSKVHFSSREYVNGVDDARCGLLMRDHDYSYLKGYNTFKRANGGELPQTGEDSNHITLIVAMLMVFSLLFGSPAIIRKKK